MSNPFDTRVKSSERTWVGLRFSGDEVLSDEDPVKVGVETVDQVDEE